MGISALCLTCGCGSEFAVQTDQNVLPASIDGVGNADYDLIATPAEKPGEWFFSLKPKRFLTPSALVFVWDFGDGESRLGANQTYTFPGAGVFLITVRAMDELQRVAFVLTLELEVPSVNATPFADAGDDQSIGGNELVFLNGSHSLDPDGDNITHAWTQIAGPPVNLVDSDKAIASFISPIVTTPVRLVFTLVVNDGEFNAQSNVWVDVGLPTIPPDLDLPLCSFSMVSDSDTDYSTDLDGPRPLRVTSTAVIEFLDTPSDATLVWLVGGETDTGPMATHTTKTYTLTTAGVHTIALSLMVSGVTIGCRNSQSGLLDSRILVWPRISGRAMDENNRGLPSVTISASAGGTTTITDATGVYRVEVPYAWSGTITAQHTDHTFAVSSRTLNNVTGDVTGQDFGEEAPGQQCTSDSDCFDNLFCSGREACINGICKDGDPPCPGQLCDEGQKRCYSRECLSSIECDDGDFCNGAERCDAGTCKSGINPCGSQMCDPTRGTCVDCMNDSDCNDDNTCTDDSCSVSGLCINQPNDANTCEDGLFCNGGESCQSGSCQTTVAPCPNQGCDEATDRCVDGRTMSGTVTDFTGGAVSAVKLVFTGQGSSSGQDFTTLTTAGGSFTQTLPTGWMGTVSSNENHRLEPASRVFPGVTQNTASVTFTAFRNYYVSLGGRDTAAGRFTSEFKTIQRGTTLARPGDTVYVRGGLYNLLADPGYDADTIHFKNSGAPGQPITVEGYKNESVVLTTSGSKAVFDFSLTWNHNTQGYGHFVFRNFKIVGGRYGWIFRQSSHRNWTLGQPVEELWVDQPHDILIEDVEVDGSAFKLGDAGIEAGIYCRNGGVRDLTVRRCNFHHTIGTEGTVDIGEWRDENENHSAPQSASHNLVFEDCDFHHAQHQQANGIVTQPTVFNVSFRRCNAYDNGKYGFGCKGSGGFFLDRCAAWGNDSTQMYARGFGGDSGASRPPFRGDITLTNCIFIAPADQRGGSAFNWRENLDISLYNCTIVGLRNGSLGGGTGGYAFLLGNHHSTPTTAKVFNCVIVGYTGSEAMRWVTSGDLSYFINTRYEAGGNVFFSQKDNDMRYMKKTWTLAQWQNYWSIGGDPRTNGPEGDDALLGPRATDADATSIAGDPMFKNMTPLATPLALKWGASIFADTDVRVLQGSAALGVGQNLSHLAMPELLVDFEGNPRPAGAWTAGACQNAVAP